MAAMEVARTIFKRCVQCPSETPTCPTCPKNEICSLVPTTCEACSYMTCIANPTPPPPQSKTNVGAIAGGVIGGVAFVALIVFFLWRFWIKKRREQQELEAEEWEEDEIDQQKGGERRFTAMRADNASTRTRGSIANSILSRASNIIQIAYIPGVMNRNGGSAHNSVAPVPPIPAAYRNTQPKSPLSGENDALFFRPGDLRGSTYSGNSSLRSGNRDTQYTRQSITPSLARSSMMSDFAYRDDATTEPMPATTVMRAAPRMVSVKSSATSPSESIDSPSPPPTANSVKVMVPGQGASTPSSQNMRAKATQITVGKAKSGKSTPNRMPSDASTTTSANFVPATSSPLISTTIDSDDEEEHARARQSSGKAPSLPLIQPLDSPFFDASERQSNTSSPAGNRPNPYATMASSVRNNPERPKRSSRGPSGLSAVYEENTRTAGRNSESEGEADKAVGGSPFSDAHATK